MTQPVIPEAPPPLAPAPAPVEGALPPAPPQDLTAAFKAGQLTFQPGQRVGVRNPSTGEIGTVPAESASDAVNAGGELISEAELEKARLEEKYGGAKGAAIAFGSGVGSGLTFGLSDAALAKVGGKDMREALKASEELNPVWHGAGVVTGIAVPSFFTAGGAGAVEGAGALARGARVAGALNEGVGAVGRGAAGLVERGLARQGAGLAERAAVKGLGAAAEGAVIGGAAGLGGGIRDEALSEEALGPPAAVAERLFAATAHGALLGGALGGAIGVGAEVGKSAIQAAAVKAHPILTREAEESAFKATGARKAFTGRADEIPGGTRAIGRQLLDDGILEAGDTVETLAPKIAKAKDAAGQAIAGKISEIGGNETVSLKQVLQKLEERAQEFDAKLGHEAAAAAVRRQKEGLARIFLKQAAPDAEEAFNASRAIKMDEGMRDLSAFRGAYKGATAEERAAIARGEIAGKNSSRPFEPIKLSKSEEGLHLTDGRHRLAAAQEAGATHIGANIREYDAAGNYTERFAHVPIQDARMLAENTQVPLQELLNARRSLEGTINWQTEAIAGQGMKAAGRTIEDFVTEAGDALAKSKNLPGNWAEEYKALKLNYRRLALANEAAEDTVERMQANAGHSLTDKIHLAHGAQTAALGLMAGHPSALLALGAGAASKLVRTRGSSTYAVLANKAASIGRIQEAMAGVDSSINKGVKAFISGKPPRGGFSGTRVENSSKVDVGQWQKAIAAYKSDPAGTVERASAGIAGVASHAPNVAKEYSAALKRAFIYLAANMPEPATPYTSPFGAVAALRPANEEGARRLNPQDAETARRMIRAAINPESVLEDFATGKLSYEAVDAVKNVSPGLFADMQKKVHAAVVAHPERFNESQKIGLSLMFDTAFDWSMTPEGIKTYQEAIAINNAEEKQKQQAGQIQDTGTGSGGNGAAAASAAKYSQPESVRQAMRRG